MEWHSAKEIAQLAQAGKLKGYPTTRDGVRRRAKKDGILTQKSGNALYFSLSDILQKLDPQPLVEIKPKKRKVVLEESQAKKKRLKEDLLNAYLARIAEAPRKQRTQTAKDFVFEYNNQIIFKEIFKVVGTVSFQTLERWKVKIRKDKDALVDTRGGNQTPKYQLTPAQEAVLVAAIRHPHGLLKAEMIRLFRETLETKGISFCPMSDNWLLRWINDWIDSHYDQYIQATKGHRATLNRCAPFLKRDWRLLEVGDCLVADGHVWNGEIAHPKTGKACRPVLLEFYDMRSNMPLGLEIMPTENIRCIAAAFRRAVIRLGKNPKYVYLDNGKAFRAKFFKGCPDFEQAGIRPFYERFCQAVIFAKVRNARAKPIERHFRTKGELARLSPSYVGTNIENKPARMIQGELLHQRFWQKMTGGILPTIEELYFAVVEWNEHKYGLRPQKDTHLDGACPLEVLNAGLGPGVDIDKLNELMLFETDKPLTQNGVKLRINGETEYFYNEIFYGKRRNVRVRYDRYSIVSKTIDWIEVLMDDVWHKAYRRVKTHPLAAYAGTDAQKEEVTRQLKQQSSLVKQTEQDFRKVVADDAQQYMQLPEPPPKTTKTPAPKVEQVDMDAVLKEVAELSAMAATEKAARPLFQSASARYEWLTAHPSEVTDDDQTFMKTYNQGMYDLN